MEKTDTRSRIIETAMRLFMNGSFDGVGVNEICRQADVVKGSFYHFFESKDDLVIAVVDAHHQQMQDVLAEAFDPGHPPLQRIRNFFDTVGDLFARMKAQSGHIPGCPMGNLATELSTTNDRVRTHIADLFDKLRQLFADTLAEARAAGQVSADLDAQAAATSIMAYFQGACVMAKTYNDEKMFQELTEQVMCLAR